MKNSLFRWSLIALLFSTFTNAQNDASLLWKIQGNGLEKPSYIYGTIHLICQDDYVMTPVIQNTLESVDAYYAEIDFSNQEEMLMMQTTMIADLPLSKRLNKTEYQSLKRLLKTINIDIAQVENLSNTALLSTIGTKTFPCKDLKVYELEFLKMALSQGKQMGGLETVNEQLELLNKNINPESLIKILEELNDNGTEETLKLVTHYKEQNIDAFITLMEDNSYMEEEAYYELLTQRNQKWIEQIPEIMERHTTFFAVGAGHLGGEEGVLQLLRDRGYEVNAVNIHQTK